MKKNLLDVLVAGAGPVGLTAALCLNKAGVHVSVADAKSSGVTHSYALALHPASLSMFDDLGVVEPILAESTRVVRWAVFEKGRRVAAVPVAEPGAKFPFIAVLGQDVLERVLAHALGARGVPVHWNLRLARFGQSATSVRVELDELEERVIGYAAARFDWLVRKTHELETKFLLGADGHHSLVRRQLLIDFQEHRPAEHFAVFEFDASQLAKDEAVVVLHDDGVGVLWPLPGGRGRWSFAVDPAKYPEAIREKDHDPVQVLGSGVFPALESSFFHRLLAERAPWFETPIDHIYWRMLVRFEKRLAKRFGEGRVWLAGDAAHLMGPAGIQSMNVGLREAGDLARCMTEVLRGGQELPRLSEYNRQRTDEWQTLLGSCGRLVPGPEADPAVAARVETLLPCLPASGRELALFAARLGLRFTM
ncbi:NAD(P)/FAD-dependent oxidoreductase [Opitutales bacterium ASA1]|uniref:FAD-dependent oxidoreductase n=1 Tax=Congregicoccus parvus TaxID=3081749 RepID=UPI002B2F5B09|nr:NAD(P)/FAD-dependent oxidoreductase [Opitutales bacterium ASA1]